MSTKTRADKWAKDTQSPFWKPAAPIFTPEPMGPCQQKWEAVDTSDVLTCYVPLLSPLTHGVELVASAAAPLTEEALADYLGTPPKPAPTSHFKYAIGYPGAYITYDEAFSWSAIQGEIMKNIYATMIHTYSSNTLAMYSGKTGSDASHVDGYTVTSALQKVLPGVTERVAHPITGQQYRVQDIIPDLNDQYRWSRDQIADWLDTLDVDLTFQPPQEKELAS